MADGGWRWHGRLVLDFLDGLDRFQLGHGRFLVCLGDAFERMTIVTQTSQGE